MFSRLERRYRRWAYDGSARAATLVITPTEHARRTAVERLDLEPDRVEAVPSGIDRARFREECADDEAELLARFALPERFLIYPANLWPHKNHELLIEALAAVEHLNVHLLLTGQPYDRLSGLLARAQRLGIGARVRHLGFVSERSMPALYRRATAMIFPSLYEGFGFPPLEAMACGCPVAASNRGSLAEVCGDAALLLDPGDPRSIASAIESIVADARLRARLRKRGLARARYFSWPASAERHREIYARVADL
jgi:glycosyltransferase involved in cell wall biosynthesis